MNSVQNVLIQIAEQIVKGGQSGPEANAKFKSLINQLSNLQDCLNALALSDNYVFVYCINMIKLIENCQFCILSQTRSEENIINLVQGPNHKSKTYGRILMSVAYALQFKQWPHYISQSIIDLISTCLKTLFQDNNNQVFLQSLISVFLPSYRLEDKINNVNQSGLFFIEMNRQMDMNNLTNYCKLLKIMTSLIDYMTVHSNSRIYYQFRRNIYIFRNSYLYYFLQFAVQHIKCLFANTNFRQIITMTLQLLEGVVMYPFSLSLHEFQVEDEVGQNISGISSGDIYFPNYFRHVLCDQQFLDTLVRYYCSILEHTQNFEEVRDQLNSLIKILGRLACPSQYTFKNDEQRIISRNFSLRLLQTFCRASKFRDSYYLHSIFDVIQKLITMYDTYLIEKRKEITTVILPFLHSVLNQAQIKIEDGKRNPFSRVFQILAISIDNIYEKLDQSQQSDFRSQCQILLETFYHRITSNEADLMIKTFGKNQPTEIDCFVELFQHVLPIFQLNLTKNLELFSRLDETKLSQGATIIWLHLCSQLLPKTQTDRLQTQIILKYFRLSIKDISLASLRYIKALTDHILLDLQEGKSKASIWINIQEIQNIHFSDFVMKVINICISNFNQVNNEILDFSLEFFKSIYMNLRRNDHQSFKVFYQAVHNLLNQIHNTIFSHPNFFHKRRAFFNVISVIWVNDDKIEYIYQIYQAVNSKIGSWSVESFYQYLHDVTGIIEPIDKHQAFEIVADLALVDLARLFQVHLTEQKSDNFFNDQYFMKIFCKLISALISDINRKLYFETHTSIPYRIHEVIYRHLTRIATGRYDLPKGIASIYEKVVNLNPLAPLINCLKLLPILKEQHEDTYSKLIKTYFQNIHRIEDIEWMYDLIEDNIDYMVNWWEEAIFRNLKPAINLKTIAESGIWKGNRQKETFAKLVFQIGYYDNSYWSIAGYSSQREFVNQYCTIYN